MGFRERVRLSLSRADLIFAVLKTLALIGGLVALFLIPVRPEHRVHFPYLVSGFIAYTALFSLLLFLRPTKARKIFLLTLAFDLATVFFFVWFTGIFESHFYLLFYLLVALNAYYFGAAIGIGAAVTAGGLYTLADFLSPVGYFHLPHLTARIAVFGLLGIALGFLSERERRTRAEVERLNRELLEKSERLERAYQELQHAQERLVRSEKLVAIGKMSAKVAHEIRNPLSAIHLNAELLEDEIQHLQGASKEEAAGLLTAIKAQVQALAELTEEYLRFARMPEPKLTPEAINEIVAELVEFLKPEGAERGVNLEVRLSPDLPLTLVDRHQLRQALLNIARNAFEAMADGGCLLIETRRTGRGSPGDEGLVEVSLTDTGCGIPPEHRDRIFEPFFTTKDQGTGLGLTITRQIVEQQGGTITCESVPGKGTTFTISLPLAWERGAP